MGFLGTIAGDLALSLGASGGVYIAGGIPTKLGDYFFTSRFRNEFEAKGRFESYLKEIPTYLITHPNIAFVGLQSLIANDSNA
jgi:glucokinase